MVLGASIRSIDSSVPPSAGPLWVCEKSSRVLYIDCVSCDVTSLLYRVSKGFGNLVRILYNLSPASRKRLIASLSRWMPFMSLSSLIAKASGSEYEVKHRD